MLILIGIICGFAFENVCIIMTMTMTMTIIIIIIIIILFFFSTYIHIHIHQYTYHTYISMHIHIYVCLPQNKDYQKPTSSSTNKNKQKQTPPPNPQTPHLTDLIRSLAQVFPNQETMEPLPSESKIRRIPSNSEVESETPNFRRAASKGILREGKGGKGENPIAHRAPSPTPNKKRGLIYANDGKCYGKSQVYLINYAVREGGGD